MSNPPRFHDSDHPLFQSTDTFQQLIQDLNHFGNIVDSDMKYLDSAIGPETNGFRLTKLKGLEDFTANTLVDALNELDSDLHGGNGGSFAADRNTAYKTVTGAINEIERVFDASAGEILYPTGDSTETQNRLLISTNQGGGQRIDIKSGQNIILDAVNNIVIDAGGSSVCFDDDSVTHMELIMGASTLEIDVPVGNLLFDVADDIILDAAGTTVDMQVAGVSRVKHDLGASNVVTVNGDYTLDVSGDITLDAGDDDVILKDGTTERFRFNCDAAPNITLTGSSASLTNTAGAFTVNAFTSFVLNTNNGASTWTFNTDTITHTGDAILDVTGDITLSADGNDIIFNNGAGGDTVTHTLTDAGAYTITQSGTGNYTLDIGGDIILDADDATIYMKDGGADRFTFIMGADQEIDVPTGSLTIDVADDIVLDAAGTNISYRVAGTNRIVYTLGATNTATVTGNYTIDASGDIVLDADDANITFKDGGVDRIAYALGATNTVTVTGNYTLDGSGDIVLDTNTGSLDLKDAGTTAIGFSLDPAATNTVAVTGGLDLTSTADVLIDATGDITLDADGNQIRFKNGAGGDEVTHNLNDDGTYEIDAPSDYTIDAAGDITLDADGGDVYLKDGGTTNYQFATNGTISRSGNLIFDISGDITLDADGNDIVFKNGAGADQVTHTLADNADYSVTYPSNVTHTQSAGSLTFDIPGDITLDADDADIFFKDAGTTRIQHTMGATNTVAVTGNYTLDVSGDIALDADGGDIDFKDAGTTRFAYGLGATNTLDITGGLTQTSGNYTNTITGSRTVNVSSGHTDSASSRTINTTNSVAVTAGTTANYTSGGATTIASGGITTIDAEGDITLDANGADIFFKDNGVTKFTFNLNGTPEIDVVTGLVLDVEGDITLDANGADVLLKDNAVQYGALTNTAGNLIIKSGTTTAMTFSGANVTVAGSITMPSSGGSSPITTAKTVHGALADINSRIPNIYDNNGTLLNPLP